MLLHSREILNWCNESNPPPPIPEATCELCAAGRLQSPRKKERAVKTKSLGRSVVAAIFTGSHAVQRSDSGGYEAADALPPGALRLASTLSGRHSCWTRMLPFPRETHLSQYVSTLVNIGHASIIHTNILYIIMQCPVVWISIKKRCNISAKFCLRIQNALGRVPVTLWCLVCMNKQYWCIHVCINY